MTEPAHSAKRLGEGRPSIRALLTDDASLPYWTAVAA